MSRAVVYRVAVVAGLVALLEICVRGGLISERVIIPPSDMVGSMIELLGRVEVLREIAWTIVGVILAFIIAVAAGFVLALVIHSVPRLRNALEPFFATYYAVPFFIFYPVLIGLLGVSIIPIVVMGFASAIVAVVIATLTSLDRIPRVLGKVGRVMRLDPVSSSWRLRLPAAAPHLFTGVKLAVSYSFIGVIASEFLLSGHGLGHAIAFAYNSFANHEMYGLILLTIVLVSVMNGLLGAWETRLMRRHGSGMRGLATRRYRGDSAWLKALDIVLIIVAAVIAWHALAQFVGPDALSSPKNTSLLLLEFFGRERFWSSAAETAKAFAYALLISVVAGLLIGLWLGTWRLAAEVGEPLLISLYALPKITLLPVLLLTFGIGIEGKVAFGVMHAIIPIVVFTMNAIRKIRPIYIKLGRTMHFSKYEAARQLLFPAALPEIVSGLRIGFSLTLLGVVVGEMFASKKGLGYLAMNAIGMGDVETTMAIGMLLFTIAGAANGLLIYLDARWVRRG